MDVDNDSDGDRRPVTAETLREAYHSVRVSMPLRCIIYVRVRAWYGERYIKLTSLVCVAFVQTLVRRTECSRQVRSPVQRASVGTS